MSRRLLALMGASVLSALLLFAPTAAQAHSELVSASPAADSTVASLTSISLTFGEEIVPDYTTLSLTAPDGTVEELSAPTYAEGNTVVTADILQDSLPNGVFTVGFYNVSVDGHPTSGSYTFTLAQPDVATAAPTPTATATTLIEPRDANDGIILISAQDSALPVWAIVLIVIGGLVVVAVVVVIVLLAARRKK